MKKFEGMLFCTDLDGTLFCNDKTVSRQNLDAIEYFKSQGGLFTFISGRVPQTAKEIYNLIKPNAPFGCFNGAGIYDGNLDKILWNLNLPTDVLDLVEDIDVNLPQIGIQINTAEKVFFNKDNAAMVLFRKVSKLPDLRCHYRDISDPIVKIILTHHDDEQISALIRFLQKHAKANEYDFIRSEHDIYEILPKGVSKGNVLCKIAALFGVKIENTIAVGDYNNDVSMIRLAGIGFAVDNAVDEAKAVADYITVSNEENAIAAIVDGLDRGKFQRQSSH